MKIERARAIILHNDKILMIQRLRDDSECYVLPGGKLEEGELPENTVMREIKEETSLDAKFIRKLDSLTDSDGNIDHIFLCEYISGTPKLSEDSPEATEISGINTYTPMWIDIKTIPSLQIWPAEVGNFLLKYLG